MNPIDQLDKLEKIDTVKATKTINKTLKSYDFLWKKSNLISAGIIASLFLVSYGIAKLIATRASSIKKVKTPFFRNITSQSSLTFIIFSLLLWAAYFIATWTHSNPATFKLFAKLSTSWVVIYSLTHMRERSVFSHIFTFFLWGLIALYITSYLDEFLSFSKKISVSAGTIEISLYSVISAYTIFGVLFWLSSKLQYAYNKAVDKSRTFTRAQKVLYKKLAKFAMISLIFMIGFRMLGVDITSIAVISGAVAVGVGFGLQKIFSNVISGIILLMDKSIKPGDVIAVGDAYGIVTNLESRYASIITRDGKKHLIPNEILVTQSVENWSYRDDKVRLSVTVGVSYDSDPKTVQKIILECAQSHPRVIKNPEPVCLFSNFGESSLDFELRFWIEDPINGIGFPQSEIRFEIWKKLKENNIKIPYPQREVTITK